MAITGSLHKTIYFSAMNITKKTTSVESDVLLALLLHRCDRWGYTTVYLECVEEKPLETSERAFNW